MKKRYKDFLLSGFIFLCLSICLPTNSFSQANFRNPIGDGYFLPGFGITIGTFANHQDMILDFGLGYDDLGFDFSVFLSGSFRPYRKKVHYKESDNLFYQMNEQVIQFSIDLEKRFYFLEFGVRNKFGLYAGLKSGYFWGKYDGFSKTRNDQFVFNPGGGLSLQFTETVRLSLGYLYYKQNPFANPHMGYLRLNLFMNRNNTDQQ